MSPHRSHILDGLDMALPATADLADLAAAAEEVVTGLVTVAISRTPVACGPGCGACCRQDPPLSLPEAFLFARRLAKDPQAPRWRQRLQRTRQRRAGAGIQIGAPCAFLAAESCLIHPLRFITCREHLVTSDPTWCASNNHPKVQLLSIARSPSCFEMLMTAAARLTRSAPMAIPPWAVLATVRAERHWGHQRWSRDEIMATLRLRPISKPT